MPLGSVIWRPPTYVGSRDQRFYGWRGSALTLTRMTARLDNPPDEKAELRRTAVARRDAMPAEARAAAELVAEQAAIVQTEVEGGTEADVEVEAARGEAFEDAPAEPVAEIAAHQSPEREAALAEPVASDFDIAALSAEMQELHRRARRVAKVAMQDIKMLRPKDVRTGRENRDICARLRSDMDKARKEYDRRFKVILDHPVDYFHDYAVAILADGDAEALGEYPYPSAVLRH